MKNQLLEDFGDSRSEPAPAREAAPRRPPSPAAGAGAQARRAQVWRGRAPAPAADGPEDLPPPGAEGQARRADPFIAPEYADFSSQQPDLAIQYPDQPAPWTERWGRKALVWTSGLALAAAVIGGGLWLVHERQVESTLALVADQSPPAAAAPEPAATVPMAAAPAPLPPLELLEPAAPVESEAVEAGTATAAAAAAAAPAIAERKPASKPAPKPRTRKPTPSRTVAARSAPRPVAAAPQLPRAAAVPERAQETGLEETLRQCRAAGYHATLCIKRGCVATKFGLACRG